MRIALAFVIALAAAGCAKKSKAAAPAAPAAAPAETGAAPDADKKEMADEAPGGGGGTQSTGDPCDGGETKAKK